MKTRKSLGFMIGVGTLLLCSISSGLAYVGSTISTYRHAAPCGVQPGLVGMLQAAHFVPSGDCELSPSGGCRSKRVCNISNPPSGGSSTGHCTDVVIPNQRNGCACTAP